MSERARILQENEEVLLGVGQLEIEGARIQAELARCLYRFQALQVEKALWKEKVQRLRTHSLRLNTEARALGRGETK